MHVRAQLLLNAHCLAGASAMLALERLSHHAPQLACARSLAPFGQQLAAGRSCTRDGFNYIDPSTAAASTTHRQLMPNRQTCRPVGRTMRTAHRHARSGSIWLAGHAQWGASVAICRRHVCMHVFRACVPCHDVHACTCYMLWHRGGAPQHSKHGGNVAAPA